MKRLSSAFAVAVVCLIAGMCLIAVALYGCSTAGTGTATQGYEAGSAATGDAALALAFAEHAEDVEVEGRGTVTALLPDDDEGDRHQRFIVQLATEQTLLIVHNIDVAPRVASLQVGDTIGFKGEYVWNEKGGLVHWTHHDPDGNHQPGWIERDGRIYQ